MSVAHSHYLPIGKLSTRTYINLLLMSMSILQDLKARDERIWNTMVPPTVHPIVHSIVHSTARHSSPFSFQV